jgi:hypothetical protein
MISLLKLFEVKRLSNLTDTQNKLLDLKVGDKAYFSFRDNLDQQDRKEVVTITNFRKFNGFDILDIGGWVDSDIPDIESDRWSTLWFKYENGGAGDSITVYPGKSLSSKENKDFNNFHKITDSISEVKRLDPERAKFLSFNIGDEVKYMGFDNRWISGTIYMISVLKGNNKTSSITKDNKNTQDISSDIENTNDGWISVLKGTEFNHIHVQFVPDRNLYYERDKKIFDSLEKIN